MISVCPSIFLPLLRVSAITLLNPHELCLVCPSIPWHQSVCVGNLLTACTLGLVLLLKFGKLLGGYITGYILHTPAHLCPSHPHPTYQHQGIPRLWAERAVPPRFRSLMILISTSSRCIKNFLKSKTALPVKEPASRHHFSRCEGRKGEEANVKEEGPFPSH